MLLCALPIFWSRMLFLVLMVGLVSANVSTAVGVRPVMRVTGNRTLFINEIVGTVGVALMVILPLATGGFSPSREDLVGPILISLGIAFVSTCVLVLTLFDIAEFERSEELDQKPQRSTVRPWRRRPKDAAPEVDSDIEASEDD